MVTSVVSSPIEPSSAHPVFSYSGGKRQLASRIVSLCRREFPNEYHLISPFLGAAAVELRFMHARRGTVIGADADPHLVMFWQNLLEDAGAIVDHANAVMPITVDIWRAWYADMMSSEWHSAEHAAKYFILRYTRVVHAWSPWAKRLEAFNAPSVHRPAFARLIQFKAPRLAVVHADFREFLHKYEGVLYCDPPYYSEDKQYEAVYKKRGTDNVFSDADHHALADLLKARKGWILSYSPHAFIRKLYRDYRQIEVNVTYASRSAQQRDSRDTELLIICPL